jgi:Bax protein
MKKFAVPILFFLVVYFLSYSANVDDNDGITVSAEKLNMNQLKDVEDKKQRFFNFMRPIVNTENEKVLALREQLIVARKNDSNHFFVKRAADSYTVDWRMNVDKDNNNWEKLLERVDAVALEVALAQSANESAWGQSRFAKQGNNFFGQWCYKKGCGIVPKKLEAGTHHEVAAFKSVNDSVRSYLKNINTGKVYAPLRKIRRKHREQGIAASAYDQAGGLIKYSQRRTAYVKEIRSMILANKQLMLGANM